MVVRRIHVQLRLQRIEDIDSFWELYTSSLCVYEVPRFFIVWKSVEASISRPIDLASILFHQGIRKGACSEAEASESSESSV